MKKKIFSSALALIMAGIVTVSCTGCGGNSSAETSEAKPTATAKSASETVKQTDALSLWKKDAPLKKELTNYIKAVTDKGGKDFIPVEDRIAVFDMDGTLCCETDPGYFDHKLLYHRVMEDPEYKDKASDE